MALHTLLEVDAVRKHAKANFVVPSNHANVPVAEVSIML